MLTRARASVLVERQTYLTLRCVLQHTQMLVVRKEGKARAQYNSFRSAFELLESVGCEPHDGFEETNADLPPLESLEKRMNKRMQSHINDLAVQIKSMNEQIKDQQQQINLQNKQIKDQQQQIEAMKDK